MDKARLMEVLNDSTCLISKGEKTQRKLPGISALLWAILLPTSYVTSSLHIVDCHFITVGVNTKRAEDRRSEFIELLESFPDQKKMQDGPSYKHVASVVGDDMSALRVFGLGQTLGLWDVLLPDQFGVDPELVDEAADLGLIVTTGYRSRLLDGMPAVATG